MITYHYYCHNCNRTMEIQQSIKEQPLNHCPECSSTLFKRLIVFNGTFVIHGYNSENGYTKKVYDKSIEES